MTENPYEAIIFERMSELGITSPDQMTEQQAIELVNFINADRKRVARNSAPRKRSTAAIPKKSRHEEIQELIALLQEDSK